MLSDAEAGNVKNKDWVMDFSLTSEQQELVDAASRFAKDRLAPSYRAREAVAPWAPPSEAPLIHRFGFCRKILPDSVSCTIPWRF